MVMTKRRDTRVFRHQSEAGMTNALEKSLEMNHHMIKVTLSLKILNMALA